MALLSPNYNPAGRDGLHRLCCVVCRHLKEPHVDVRLAPICRRRQYVFIDGVRFSPADHPARHSKRRFGRGGIFLTATVQPGLSGVLMTATSDTASLMAVVHTNPPNAAGQVVFN